MVQKLKYETNRTAVEIAIELDILAVQAKLYGVSELDTAFSEEYAAHAEVEDVYRRSLKSLGYTQQDINRGIIALHAQATEYSASMDQTSANLESITPSKKSAHTSDWWSESSVVSLAVVASMFVVGMFVEKARSWAAGEYQPV